jgi:hypothetical protein
MSDDQKDIGLDLTQWAKVERVPEGEILAGVVGKHFDLSIRYVGHAEVPPLPPHITLDQAKKFSQSLAKGDSHTGEMVAGAARQLLSAILPDHQISRPRKSNPCST